MNKFHFTQTIAQRFIQAGINIPALLLSAGILVNKLPMTLTVQQFSNLMKAVTQQNSDPLLGIKLGHISNIQQVDPATFVALHSANLAKALDKIAKYKSLTCPEVVKWHIQQGCVKIHHYWLDGVVVDTVLIDGFFANIASMVRLALDKKPIAIYLTRATVPMGYEHYFECPLYLNASQDEIWYDEAILELPFRTFNDDLIAAILPSLNKQLSADRIPSLDEQVKNVMFSMMNGDKPTLENVAKRLNVSKRTLQRKLHNLGINYQILLDEVRLSVAYEMLERTELKNGEIAFYLGFDEVNSFYRFFVNHTDKTPQAWRIEKSKDNKDTIGVNG